MKILDVQQMVIPDVRVIRVARFADHRGYFAEQFRQSDFETNDQTSFLRGIRFLQANESFSYTSTIRGLHFQWNPYMGKLVRTLRGRMIDLFLDVRLGSPTFGKIAAYDMPSTGGEEYNDWIWVPPGFAHGNTFTEDTLIEYFCSGEYSPGCEAGISPLADDIDWSLCEPELKVIFDTFAATTSLMTDKDRHALSVQAWTADVRSNYFFYGDLS